MSTRTRNRTVLRRAYSLLEVSVSLSAASLLLVGVGSTVYVASRASDSASSGASSVVGGSLSAEQIAAEMQYAVSFTERSPTATEFTIADRNGDAVDDNVRFEWSGKVGDPVTRSFNGGVPQPIADSVGNFDLAYNVQTTSTTQAGGSGSMSAETLLASFNGWSGLTPTESNFSLLPGYWMSECFAVDWPTGAGDLKITRVRLKLAQTSTSGQFSVGIYPASGGTGPLPSASPIGTEAIVSCTSVPTTADWVDVAFSDVTLTDSASKYNIVVKGISSGGFISYWRSYSAPADATVAKWTTNSGGSWSPSSSMEKYYDVPFHFYGTYTTSNSGSTTVDRYFVRSVRISLQVGSDASSRVDTAAEVLNAPEVASP